MNNTVRRYNRRRRRRNNPLRILVIVVCLGVIGVLTALLLSNSGGQGNLDVSPGMSDYAIVSPTPVEPTPTPLPPFSPAPISETLPSYYDFTFGNRIRGHRCNPPINFDRQGVHKP